mmetsp:Transcript_3659/g.13140  ORF Transcript_3659/g.13140 Transcript_3659/m.13140 type:complete len:174 (+) Transcript_3659:385-906(+)
MQAVEELGNAMADTVEWVTAQLKEQFQDAGEVNLYEDAMKFVHAVDWSEPWIIGVICLHVVTLIAIVQTAQNQTAQTFLFAYLMACVYFAEWLNTMAGKHWEKFSRQMYFDPSGFFISVLWSLPMLLMMLVVLVNFLRLLSSMLIQMKRAELKYRAKQMKADSKAQREGKKSK